MNWDFATTVRHSNEPATLTSELTRSSPGSATYCPVGGPQRPTHREGEGALDQDSLELVTMLT